MSLYRLIYYRDGRLVLHCATTTTGVSGGKTKATYAIGAGSNKLKQGGAGGKHVHNVIDVDWKGAYHVEREPSAAADMIAVGNL